MILKVNPLLTNCLSVFDNFVKLALRVFATHRHANKCLGMGFFDELRFLKKNLNYQFFATF